jgi:hypothetical protein
MFVYDIQGLEFAIVKEQKGYLFFDDSAAGICWRPQEPENEHARHAHVQEE